MKSLAYLIHGFVFAFGSAIILYAAIDGVNIFVSPRDVVSPILFSVLAFFLFVLVAYLATRRLEAAGLIASLLVLGFFYLWSVFLAVILQMVRFGLITQVVVGSPVLFIWINFRHG